MAQTGTRLVAQRDSDELWLGSKVRQYSGNVQQLRALIPTFERKAFQIPGSAAHPALEAILYKPTNEADSQVPIGVVSRSYQLLQHADVFNAACVAITDAGISLDRVDGELRVTELWERMELGLVLPEEYSFSIAPDDQLALRLICFNSVDGSTRFTAVVGWLRFVCGNGLFTGAMRSSMRRVHNWRLSLGKIDAVLANGLETAVTERRTFEGWSHRQLSDALLRKFVNGTLTRRWGVKAAVRAYHIFRTGHDATMINPFEKANATERATETGEPVPGIMANQGDLFSFNQVLAWLARERRDVSKQVEWMKDIAGFMDEVATGAD